MGQDAVKAARGSTGSWFVRRYLRGISLVVGLMVLSIFWGFRYQTDQLIKEQLRQQGQAFFDEVVVTRKWAADQGGVYVKLRPGVTVNPYLQRIPGLKAVITATDGDQYTLKNPALMTREISEIASRSGLFRFKISSLKPLNPGNAADPFERAGLLAFERGTKVYAGFETRGDQEVYRYMAPLVTESSCLKCHGAQGYRVGDIRGGICVTIVATSVQQRLRQNDTLLLVAALGIVGLFLALLRFLSLSFVRDLRNAEAKLTEMATRDWLTGLFNRRELVTRAAVEFSRARRHGKPLCVILIDIDFFKKINDQHGHDMGDLVLKQLAARLQKSLRDYDIVCRYGGEEFLVVAPETPLASAIVLAERLRIVALHDVVASGPAATPVGITISLGVAQVELDETFEQTVSRADAALFRAKQAGRNRVEAA